MLAQLQQGTSPKKLALSVALGLTFGLFPVVGATSLLCLAAGVLFRLNHVALQAANYAAYPLQLLLLYPLLQAGRSFFGFAAGGWGWGLLGMISVWALFAPVAGVLLFFISLPVLRWADVRLRQGA